MGVSKGFKILLIVVLASVILAKTEDQAKPECNLSPTWQMNWAGANELNEILSRVHCDDHLAVYYDSGLSKSITWPFLPLSKAYKYVKATYGPLGTDPRLYLVLRANSAKDCNIVSKPVVSRNVIDCGQTQANEWTASTSAFLEKLLSSVAKVVRQEANGIHNDANLLVSRGIEDEIIVYDIYVHVKSENDSDVNRWKIQKLQENEEGIYFFREWFLPMYDRFVGAEVMVRFYNLTHDHLPKNAGGYRFLTTEEFIHFWSETAGTDLFEWAQKVFNFRKLILGRMRKVHKDYPQFKYSESVPTQSLASHILKPPGKWQKQGSNVGNQFTLSLVYYDAHVAFYSGKFQLFNISSLKLISAAWHYAKENFGPFSSSNNQRLYIAIPHSAEPDFCTASNTESYIDPITGHGHEVDCFHTSKHFDSQNKSIEVPVDDVILQIALLTLRLSKKTGNWPAQMISGWSMSTILVYDMYVALNMVDEAQQWRDEQVDEKNNVPNWFRDWYLPIYESHGNNSNVLNAFFNTLHKNWLISKHNYQYQLCTAEFIHFWSGATGKNLKNQGLILLPENKCLLDAELNTARNKYRTVGEYPLETSKEVRPDVLYIPRKYGESGKKRKQFLKVYNDTVDMCIDIIALYPQIKFQAKLLKKMWVYVQDIYTDILSTADPSLYVTYDGEKGDDCYAASSSNVALSSSCPNVQNKIECSNSVQNAKHRDTDMDRLILTALSQIIRERMKFEANSDLASEAVVWILKAVVFDMYLIQKRFQEAYEWLKFKVNDQKISSMDDKLFWFRHWALPIYTHYGGVHVLNRFLSATSKHLPMEYDGDKLYHRKHINFGEFVHLWSGAAGDNLKDLATNAFGWKPKYENDLMRAKEDHPEWTADCSKCKEMDIMAKIEKENRDAEMYAAIVAGCSVFFLVMIFIIFGGLYRVFRKRIESLKDQIRDMTPQEVSEFLRGDDTCFQANSEEKPIHLRPFNTEFEVQSERLVFENKLLGQGEFGQVFLGTLKCESGDDTDDVQVAVKTVKPNVGINYFKAMLNEIKIMAYLGKHENITSLLGTVTHNIKNREVFVALEFCDKGDLLQSLRRHRTNSNFTDLWHQSGQELPNACHFANDRDKQPCIMLLPAESNATYTVIRSGGKINISNLNLIEWSRQIANGMVYLSDKKVIHSDLAARNVLLTANNVAKISDFGLSRQLINYSKYTKKSTTPLPWRWMAIESLSEMIFSVHSDVWAFGVTMWEIFSLGKVPFPSRKWDHEFVGFLSAGGHLECPAHADQQIYDLMLKCWKMEPAERIAFCTIRDQLDSLKASLLSVNQLHGGMPGSCYDVY